MNAIKIAYASSGFPAQLKQISDAPKQIYLKGQKDLDWARPMVAIVGSRRPTPYGRAVTAKIAGELAKRGVIVVSGLALGIDSIAHQAALDAGGKTVAVLPCGLDEVYPRSHLFLARQIEKNGCLISEYPEDTEPRKENFIARNRLIAGLSQVVVITEAAEKSGSLHTAQFALDDGKTVMAVPGNITSYVSIGTNNLIKQGAAVVTSAEDVLNELGINYKSENKDVIGANQEEQVILDLVKDGCTDSVELAIKSRLKPDTLNQTLTMLELSGKIRSTGGGQWSLN